MEESPGVRKYREFEKRLAELREAHHDGSPEEDALLDEADDLWWEMTEEERTYINTTKGPYYDSCVKWLKTTTEK